ncbi:hypothetical protein INT47_001769 [Mucor saturninus]|uniref:Uncharacterized protein n=1 Tax=Mucor saturninus TaxID=64648 RepID=A0A8H7VDE9_9FUNG|nr:hypothetical protein INT47_001769 [Mucor saturninus]
MDIASITRLCSLFGSERSWMIHCALSLCRLFEELVIMLGEGNQLTLSIAFQHLANRHSIYYKMRLELCSLFGSERSWMIHCALSLCRLFEELVIMLGEDFQPPFNISQTDIASITRLCSLFGSERSWMTHCALSLCRLFEELVIMLGEGNQLTLSTAFQHLTNGHNIYYKVPLD